MDEQKRADIKLKNAQADAIYANLGAVDPAWLYEQRHKEAYQFDPHYDPEAYADWLAENNGAIPSGTTFNDPQENQVAAPEAARTPIQGTP